MSLHTMVPPPGVHFSQLCLNLRVNIRLLSILKTLTLPLHRVCSCFFIFMVTTLISSSSVLDQKFHDEGHKYAD
jgi:hypothetical protein